MERIAPSLGLTFSSIQGSAESVSRTAQTRSSTATKFSTRHRSAAEATQQYTWRCTAAHLVDQYRYQTTLLVVWTLAPIRTPITTVLLQLLCPPRTTFFTL